MVSRVFDKAKRFHGRESVGGGLDRFGMQQRVRGNRDFLGDIFARRLCFSSNILRDGRRKASFLLNAIAVNVSYFPNNRAMESISVVPSSPRVWQSHERFV